MRLSGEKDEAAAAASAASPYIPERQFPHKGDVVAPLVPARSQIGKVGINDGRRARSSSRRGRRFLFQGTVDPARTDADELGNLLFVAALSIQFPDPLMHAYSLAMTRTTLSRNFFRYCRPLSRTCFACAALYRLFERTLLLAKELLQGFGKVLTTWLA